MSEVKPDRFQEMENERNSRMMVLMTALKDYIGCVTTEINELRSLAQVGVPADKLPGEPVEDAIPEKPKTGKKTTKKTTKKTGKKTAKKEPVEKPAA